MPNVDGLEATRRIAADEDLAGVRVIILTTFESDEYVYQAIRAGASGFLVKDSEPAELIQAVRVVARGEALLVAQRHQEADHRPGQPARQPPGDRPRARRPDRAGTRGHDAGRGRPVERRDRRPPVRQPADRQDPRQPHHDQARRPRPRPARRAWPTSAAWSSPASAARPDPLATRCKDTSLAITELSGDRFTIITGGPGTGKTSLIAELRRRGFAGTHEAVAPSSSTRP